MAAAGALVAAESILALTPIAIKKTPLDPISVIWTRILSSAGIGYAVASNTDVTYTERLGAIAIGGTNLLHIASSYESFRHLPAGQAMSLLYTFPLWTVIFGALFGGDRIRTIEFAMIAVATAGAVILNMDPSHVASVGADAAGLGGAKANRSWGIAMGLIMAMTEAGMHTLLHKMNWLDPAKAVWVVNSSAAVWLASLLGLQNLLFDSAASPPTRGDLGDFVWLTVFHGFTLFSGYWLRFYSIPRLSTVTYSILSYTGLLAAFLFGLWFVGERPGWMSLIGATCIIGSGAVLQMMESSGDKKQLEE